MEVIEIGGTVCATTGPDSAMGESGPETEVGEEGPTYGMGRSKEGALDTCELKL